ncbi:hypothetical protein HOD75_02490 [archaeon]|jgi:hypothetical protein|nr:hypothetical protein [archaeon]MBT4241747.1 hypothetical protein [archaeon]MBT4418295.1 hypothetical protein [archaeon]
MGDEVKPCIGKFLFLGVFLVLSVLFSLNFVVADFNNCWDENSINGGTKTSCNAAGCLWASNDPSEVGSVTDFYDMFCGGDTYDSYCCFPNECWQHDGTNASYCEDSAARGLNCTWDPFMNMYHPNGSLMYTGGCMNDWSAGGGDWGGMDDGCWQFDGDKATCTSGANAAKCSWSVNGANENPWCGVKTLGDAQMKNSLATLTDVGCCEQKGCWSYDNNQTNCEGAFEGNCVYDSSWGGCMTKWCGEITDETNCTYVQQQLFMPCTWDGDSCEDSYGDGGFGFFNTSDSCFDAGGWYNSSGACVMPSGGDIGGGGGGFMFGGEAHCWFADNQLDICKNITGCGYCVAGGGPFGVDNSSAENICYNKQIGYCEGHNSQGSQVYTNANNSFNLNCTHIQVKSACNFGPLPNCKWINSSSNLGAYCSVGASSEGNAGPPVDFCEHPDSKNNYTLCMQLIENYMMPCSWENSTYPIKNCTFNQNKVFKDGEKDLGLIGSDIACTSAGGTWQTEYYVEDSILKQDSWCEMTGFFDIDNGGGEGNKGNCDTSCWACEFQYNGSAWSNNSVANLACENSELGYCQWTNDSNAFNGFGWCDYPQEMEYSGSGDCNTNCEDCDFMNYPYDACVNSVANNNSGCKWVNDSAAGAGEGYCVDVSKKICDSDCFSCFDETACYASSISCAWDSGFGLCSPQGYTGEICFDGIDNDGDVMIDCADPDCGYDNFCGGSAVGGDCFAQTTEGTCNQTVAFNNLNCSWLNDTWNTDGWCDMPGMNCWKFDNNLSACGLESGCTNDSSSMGGASNMCDMNQTKMENANCWSYTNATCDAQADCQWKEDSWCVDNPSDSWCLSSGGGWCDYAPFAQCMDLNSTTCSANSNCTWNQDDYSMQGGWCDVACFNWSISTSESCEGTGSTGLCEWRDMSATCQPETFMMFGGSSSGGGEGGGSNGCWQYDGNETGCWINNITCQYKNDSYANNNKSDSEASGWCMTKGEFDHFGVMGGDVTFLADDDDNINGLAEAGVAGEVDIMGMGMRISDEGFNFGAGLINASDSIVCNGYYVGTGFEQTPSLGTGNKPGSFYWYLDTDGLATGSCVAYGGSNDAGYEFMINYLARNTSEGVVETKQLMRCNSGNWTPTNALITTSKQMSCGEVQGVMIGLSKQDLESFSEYNKTSNMRIFMASANGSDTRLAPSDYVGPGYYTPGTIDFGFVDCSDPTTKDPKCKNVQKFGFNVYEECMNGIDDDENGLIDCDDPMCSFTPKCASGDAFDFSAVNGDVVAPNVMFSEVDTLADGAFVRIDTNEPSSLNLTFYHNDSTCAIANLTIEDSGVGYLANANYKPFHSVDLIFDSLGYNLVNNTVYYYKIKVCDPSGNCAISACSNFTTKTTTVDKSFIFKMDLPTGYTVDIPALNKTDYNFTEEFNDVVYDVGVKTNTSVTKNMNMTIHCGDMSIGFFGMNVLEPIKIDLSEAFICDEVENMMGMNSSLKKWNTLINSLKMGGATDYIEVTMPVTYSASNSLIWADDVGTSATGEDVDDYVNCFAGDVAGTTVCRIPVSMGFSTYAVSVPSAGGDSSSSGGGGGGGGILTTTPTSNASADTESVSGSEGGDSVAGTGNVVGDSGSEGGFAVASGGMGMWAIIIGVIVLVVVVGIVIAVKNKGGKSKGK